MDERDGTKRWIQWWEVLCKGKHKTTVLVVIGVIGVVLIGLSGVIGNDDEPPSVSSTTFDTRAYTDALEARLSQMVSCVQGAGKARVMVTLENGVEYIYADEQTVNSDRSENGGGQISTREDSKRSVVTVDGGDGKEGLLVTQIEPTVRGVVVACEGAENATVASRVKEAVRTALDITDKRVCVIPYATEGESWS